MFRHLRFTYSLALAAMALVAVAGEALAQTPEGTVITNTALASVAIAQGGSITLKIVYNVASGQGGVSTVYTLTANSRRTPATSGNAASTVTPATTYAATTTPDGGQNVQRLPGNSYSFTFSVGNNGNGNDNFDVIATSPGSPVITIVSVNGLAGDSTRITLAPAASQTVAVVYNVANVAGGSTGTPDLRARSVGQPATFDDGFMDLTVIKPNVTLAKAAYLDDGVTPVSSGVVPGQGIPDPFTVTNSGGTSASSVQVTEALTAEVTYVSTSSSTGWSVSVSGQTVTANYTGTGGVLAASSSATFELRVSVN